MAVFRKRKSLDDYSIDELEKYIEERREAESIDESEDIEREEVAKEEVEAVEVDETEVAETAEAENSDDAEETDMPEEESDESHEEVEEHKEDEIDEIKSLKELVDAQSLKYDALAEELSKYKESVDALLERVGEIDKEADAVGLTKAEKAEGDTNDNELSAFEYAKKYAKY